MRIEIWRKEKGMEIGVSLDCLVQWCIWPKVSSYRIVIETLPFNRTVNTKEISRISVNLRYS